MTDHLFRCGTPPKPGETLWIGDRKNVMTEAGPRPIEVQPPRRSIPERIAVWLICPACLLPTFIPGHRLRGCTK